MTKLIRIADIIESPDDGGWYASVDDHDPAASPMDAFKEVAVSDILPTKAAAEAFARKHGATRLFYP